MTAVTTAPAATATRPGGGDAGAISMFTLIRVELRKLADTRAGLWLLIVIGLASLATVVVLLTAGDPAEQTFQQFFTFGLVPAGILLPVLGILSMTSEWSQRTALSTFTLVPVRGRILVAKLAAGVVIAVLATAAAAATGALGNLVALAGDGDGSWRLDGSVPGQAVLMEVLFVLMGSAFGALLLNSALAIVLYFAIPLLWTTLGSVIGSLKTPAAWLDLNLTTQPLAGGESLTALEWQRLAASAAVWVVVPLVLGLVRVLRREVS